MKNIFLLMVLIVAYLSADQTIEIVKKIDKKPTIAIAGDSSNQLSRRLLKLIIGDLKVSGHFRVNENIIEQKYDASDLKPDVELLLKTKFQQDPTGRLAAKIKLLNAKNGNRFFEKSYAISKGDRYPFLAHNIAIDINDYYKFPSIDWMRRYILFAKYTSSGKSSIYVADYTLSFKKRIVSGGLNIFPKWADSSQQSFYYTSYNGKKPTLYKLNVYTGSKQKIISSNGMVVCSDVSRDGSKLLITMAPKDQPDIYLYDLNSGSKKRITKFRGIDVGGNFVDGDSAVIFVSDRLGYPNIFYKRIGGGKVEQMVFHGKNNSSCTTYDKYIVYSSRESISRGGRSTFNLYLISTQTDFIRKLTQGGKNMFPRFADDGETILYIKNSGGVSNLGILRLNENRSFLFPLREGRIQSIDW